MEYRKGCNGPFLGLEREELWKANRRVSDVVDLLGLASSEAKAGENKRTNHSRWRHEAQPRLLRYVRSRRACPECK